MLLNGPFLVCAFVCLLGCGLLTHAAGRLFTSAFALAIASYMSLYSVLLMPPLALLGFDRRTLSWAPHRPITYGAAYAACTVSAIGGLLLLSYFVTGRSWEFISSTYGFHLLLPDLTPNVGLWWYFFIEMFDSFRAFFIGVFWLHLASYVGGLSVKFRYVQRCLASFLATGS